MIRLEKVLLFKYNGEWRTEIFEEDGNAFFHRTLPTYKAGIEYATRIACLYQLPLTVEHPTSF